MSSLPVFNRDDPEVAELVARTRDLCGDIFAVEDVLSSGGEPAAAALAQLQAEAREAGLWALGHPRELGGGGLDLVAYTAVHMEQGRSEFGPAVFGSASRQDAIALARHGHPELQERFMDRLVHGGEVPSLAMTEPGRPGSDPGSIAAEARPDGDSWVLDGHKWFVTGADSSPYTTVMCRTEPEGERNAFTMIVVPEGTPGVNLLRETPLLGLARGHWEVRYEGVRVPLSYTIGRRGEAGAVAQERLAPGRLLHAARWIGQAYRAVELMMARLSERRLASGRLRDKQLMQEHLFDAVADVEASRLMALSAAQALQRGESARMEVGLLKVVAARMHQAVVDRAVQVFGAEAFTDDSPLARMYRTARFGRIYDGPDEVHIESVVRRILKEAVA